MSNDLMPRPSQPGPQQRSRRLTGRLWLLTGLLAAGSLYMGFWVVHNRGEQETAARLVAGIAAQQVVVNGAQRLEVLALQTFGPVLPGTRPAGPGPDEGLAALAAGQRAALACRCRDTLPIRAFLHFDPSVRRVRLRAMSGESNVTAALPGDAALATALDAALARADSASRSTIQLWPILQDSEWAVLALTSGGTTFHDTQLFGAVVPLRQLAGILFAPRELHPVQRGSVGRLDSLSVQVTSVDGTVLYGRLASDRRFRAMGTMHGPLEALRVTVALHQAQVRSHLVIAPPNQLWLLGLLIALTILVATLAASASRREVSLARARSDFIAGVSHDLRMPLAQILLASETLAMQRERSDQQRRTLASSIVREARRLIGMVDNVLFFSRAGTVELRPDLHPVAVGELFADVVDAVELSVADAGQSIAIEADDRFSVRGDRSLLRQALVNLVDNAIKYGSPGQRIRLVAERAKDGGIRLVVEDQGAGIPAGDRRRLFAPWERLGRDESSERTGTGLGLAVVRDIARACQARVWLEEAPGGGTRAILELQSEAGSRRSADASVDSAQSVAPALES